MRRTLLLSALLGLSTLGALATSIGYSNGTIDKLNLYKFGTSTTQGQAIRLTKAKLQMLKGKSIDYVEFVPGTKLTKDNEVHLFISTAPGGAPIAEGTVKIERTPEIYKWTLDKPYTITGDEEKLYVGYTAETNAGSKILMFDGSYDISGCNFVLKDGEWTDTYGFNIGSACITFNVEGADDYTDIIMARNTFGGYFKANTPYGKSIKFINAGTTAVTSFDTEVKVGSKLTTHHYEGLNIKPKGKYNFSLEGFSSDEEGDQNISIEIKNVNGESNEYDTSDNNIQLSGYFYPQNMERSLLVDGFTGQKCSACPTGHTNIKSAIESYGGSVVEISHHSGYYPDIFTMKEDIDAEFYYNNATNTWAPAVAVNRTPCVSISQFPVVETLPGYILALLQNADEKEPYVSLNLETKLNKSTRELKVKLGIKPHKKLPSDKLVYNIYLVQDDITAYQASGGASYVHKSVSRGTLTGDSWGIELGEMTPGEVTETKEITFNIPEKIHSSFWTDDMIVDGKYAYKGRPFYELSQTDIEAVLENMKVVAYVQQYDKADNTKNLVYNCCEAKAGESHRQAAFGGTDGIETASAKENTGIYARNGKITVAGKYDRMFVYSISGKQVNPDATLAEGVYIVKVISGGKQETKKILVK